MISVKRRQDEFRGDLILERSYTIHLDASESVGAKPLKTNGIELKARIVVGVCD